MKYEEYLDRFCSNETVWKKTGDPHRLTLPWRIRLKIWLLERKGYLVRIEVEYHYHSVYPGKRKVQGAEGFGTVRIHKYKPNTSISEGLELEEGKIGE